MSVEESRLEALIECYWIEHDTEHAHAVLKQALAHPPSTPTVLARAADIATRAGAPPMQPRIETRLNRPLERLQALLPVVDALGDEHGNLDQAIFDGLSALSLEMDLANTDFDTVRRARDGATSRPDAALRVINTLADALPDGLRKEISRTARDLCDEARRFQAHALVIRGDDESLVLGIQLAHASKAGIDGADYADDAMTKQARAVLAEHLSEGVPGLKWSLELPVRYSGGSLGLALHVAALVAVRNRKADPLLAATGVVDTGGDIRFVDGIGPKLMAAARAGMQRVLIPAANEDEISELELPAFLRVIPVSHIDEVQARLDDLSIRAELSFDGRIRKARSLLSRYGVELVPPYEDDVDNARRLHVADATGKATLMLWIGGKGTVTATGKQGTARAALERLIADHFEVTVEARAPLKRMVGDPARRQRLAELLDAEGGESLPAYGAKEQWRYRLRTGQSAATVTQWETGTCMVDGKAPAHDRARELLLSVLGGLDGDDSQLDVPRVSVRSASATDLPPLALGDTWIGTDESGKGDFFGPLVSAAVVLDERLADELTEIGVRDSKKLSDRRIRSLAQQLRQTLGKKRYKVTPIHPARFNSLYREMKAEGKNLNTLLAWGHTRSIEDLLQAGQSPRYAIVDQFADARYIERKLLEDTRRSGMPIIQFPKAEADMAVAAASILARETFVQWLDRESANVGLTLPKGAGPAVIEAGRALVAQHGQEELGRWAKLSFKTTKRVLE